MLDGSYNSPMQLLVSAADAKDAFEAGLGGADIVDAKDPSAGALGAVPLDRFVRMRSVVPPRVPLTAALGDDLLPEIAEARAAEFAAAGARFVKVGTAAGDDRFAALIRATVRGAVSVAASHSCGVVAALFADRLPTAPESIGRLVRLARDAGAAGLLIDTSNKQGPRLLELVPQATLTAWVQDVHEAGLFAAVAGGLTRDDLGMAFAIGADIAGVRGAACLGGRNGPVTRDRIAALRAAADRAAPRSDGSPSPVVTGGETA